jgi:hypothetical protein
MTQQIITPQPGDYVRHPYGRNGHSTSRVTKVENGTVTVTRRGKNYTFPLAQVTAEAASCR